MGNLDDTGAGATVTCRAMVESTTREGAFDYDLSDDVYDKVVAAPAVRRAGGGPDCVAGLLFYAFTTVYVSSSQVHFSRRTVVVFFLSY